MAIRKSITAKVKTTSFVEGRGTIQQSEADQVFAGCYIRVESVTGSKLLVSIIVSTKLSDTVTLTTDYSFVPDMSGGNFIAQAYGHLKTLPEFAGAEDC